VAPSEVAEGFPRGITKWATFTVFFTVVPVGFDLLVLLFEREPIDLQVLFAYPSTYLIGFGITANGLGDAVFGKRQMGRAPLGYIIFDCAVGACFGDRCGDVRSSEGGDRNQPSSFLGSRLLRVCFCCCFFHYSLDLGEVRDG
jgi:hypothetical protein